MIWHWDLIRDLPITEIIPTGKVAINDAPPLDFAIRGSDIVRGKATGNLRAFKSNPHLSLRLYIVWCFKNWMGLSSVGAKCTDLNIECPKSTGGNSHRPFLCMVYSACPADTPHSCSTAKLMPSPLRIVTYIHFCIN